MTLKEHYRRFRAWQIEPSRYTNRQMESHCCNNCGHEFVGDFCPVCGQRASWGRITWSAVRENVMLLWGMDSHSMPYTLFQLLLRPGYLIGEYISGRRQVSYPPVKMLFIVAVIFAIIMQLLGIKVGPYKTAEGSLEVITTTINWIRSNPGWGAMAMTLFLTIPTWFLFHFSPRHSRHTFPEGVFIQIFMSSLMLICTLVIEINPYFIILIPFYYYITYRQLFGYNFWGTCWRLLLGFVVWVSTILMLVVMTFIFTIPDASKTFYKSEGLWGFISLFLLYLIPVAALLLFGHWIGRRTEKKHLQNTDTHTQPNQASPKMVK